MKIAATAVSMEAARTYREVEQRYTKLSPAANDTSVLVDDFGVRFTRSLSSSSHMQFSSQSLVGLAGGGGVTPISGEPPADSGQGRLVSQLAAQVIGQPVSISYLQENAAPFAAGQRIAPGKDALFAVQRAELRSSIVYRQEETLLFSARGQVRAMDGREISFSLGLSMERKTVFSTDTAIDLRRVFIDPLVLQFDAGTPLLGESVFLFDLDGDGGPEQLACPGIGCGFLAFDKNSDGVINNGLELFGPASGSGFGELAAFDTDANTWIDENDPIFANLLIWRHDGQGGQSLQSLAQAGVGAISITNAGSSFQLEGSDGTILGAVKASGIFLTETGEVRSLQELDMAVPSQAAAENASGRTTQDAGFEATLQALREIIAMQQFRLRMMLAERRLQLRPHNVEQRQWLLGLLQNRSLWPAMGDDRADGREGTRSMDGVSVAELLSPRRPDGKVV